MRIRDAVKLNAEGQLVIPKEIREKLRITAQTPLHIVFRGSGFYIYPIRAVISFGSHENSYLKILQTTRGAWTAGSNSVMRS